MMGRAIEGQRKMASELHHIAGCLTVYAEDLEQMPFTDWQDRALFIAAELKAASRMLERHGEVLEF